MGQTASLDFKIYLDQADIKTGLAKVQQDFQAASAGITAALTSIKGFDALKRQVQETSDAYVAAQKKVAGLAKTMQAGGGGEKVKEDFKKAREEAIRLKDSLAKQQEQLQRTRDAMMNAGVSMTNLSGQQAKLRTQLDATKQKYMELAKVAGARETLQIAPHAEISAQIDKARQAYATLASSGKASMAELAQAKVAMGARIDELRAKTNGWRESLVGAKMQMVEVAAAIAPMGLAVAQAIKFESSMADVKKVIDATPAGFQALRSELLQMTRDIPLTAGELAQIAAAGGQLGIASSDIDAFVRTTAKMATAFDMTAQEAGEAIGKIKNVYGMAVGEIEGFGDSINQLGNNTAARERDIVEVMLRIGGTSKQFGLASEQAAALSAAMLSMGKSPEVASTAINALLNNMQTATMQSGTFQEALAKIGTDAEAMAAAVAGDPQKALGNLLKTLSQLEGQQRAEVLTGLFGKEFQDDIGTLVGSLGEYEKALGLVGEKSAYVGTMNKEFDERAATTANQLLLLKNAVNEAGINLGTVFLPAIRAIIAPITTAIQAIASIVQQFPMLSSGFAMVGTGFLVFGQVARLAGIAKLAMVSMASESVSAFSKLRATSVGLGSVFSNLGGVLSALAVGWEIGTWLNQFDIVKKAGILMSEGLTLAFLKVKQAWAWLTGGNVDAVQREIEEAKRIYKEMYQEVGSKAKEAGGEQVKAQSKVTEAVKQSAGSQQQATKEALDEMQKQYQDYANQVKEAQEDIGQRTKSVAERIREMNREEMSDKDAWLDRKKEAEEYFSASVRAKKEGQAALEAGDAALANLKFTEAKEAGDKAIDAFAQLKGAVKDGDSVFKTSSQSLKIASDGMKRSADVANAAVKSQMDTAAAAMDGLIQKSGFSDLSKGMEEAKRAWLTNWQNMQAASTDAVAKVEERVVKMVTPERTMWINVRAKVADDSKRILADAQAGTTVEQFAVGGLIQKLAAGGGVRSLLAGGHFPGYGGGDRRLVLAEDGEFMVRKEVVKATGVRVLQALNAGRLDIFAQLLSSKFKRNIGYRLGGLVDSLPRLPVQHLSQGGSVESAPDQMPAKVVELRFSGGRVQGDEQSVEMLLQHLETAGLSA